MFGFPPVHARSCLVAVALALVCFCGDGRAAVISTVVTDPNQMPGVFSSPLPAGGSITVSGYASLVNGAPYDGEGYVVGPKSNGVVTPYTLTAYNGKAFIINDRFGSGSDRIKMHFSFPIYSLSFDYEIFPNANVANGTNRDPNTTPGWPDITVKADGQQIFRDLGELPGPNAMFGFTASPNHPNGEVAPQFVGSSPTFSFPGGVTDLEFIDWPPVIGINNIQFNALQATSTPEPASLAVFSVALVVGAGAYRLRRRFAARRA